MHYKNSSFVVAAIFLAAVTVSTAASQARAETAGGSTYVVGVEGMSCPVGCAPKVQSSLETVEGVQSVDVNFDDKQAVVRMAPGKVLTQDQCNRAFGNSGYFVSSFAERKEAGETKGGG